MSYQVIAGDDKKNDALNCNPSDKWSPSSDTGFPLEWQIPLKHFRQRFNWDCGLACVAMILPEDKRKHFLENFNDVCKSEGFNKSTWTIDLCFLLTRYGIPYKFTTLMLGVRNGYKGNSFYEKVFNKDEDRVNSRFAEASLLGLHVHQRQVTIEDILKHLLFGPVLLLTNARILNCETCKHNKIATELRKCLPLFDSYQGHYILLCGYNVGRQIIYYQNPAFHDHTCVMRFSYLDEARKYYGTDEDTIFIYKCS